MEARFYVRRMMPHPRTTLPWDALIATFRDLDVYRVSPRVQGGREFKI
jgi:hypothetical protein